jgi:hypothetical protein
MKSDERGKKGMGPMYMQLAFLYSFRQAKVAGEHLDLSSREFPENVESFIHHRSPHW